MILFAESFNKTFSCNLLEKKMSTFKTVTTI